MAGGTWTSQNEVQPGVYINTKSAGNIIANVGTKGIVAIAKPLSWGKTGVIQTITPGEDITPYIGYDITNQKAMFLREMMKGSDITPGPAQILLYRPAGTGGAAATATIGALTATALYTGVRGNDITIIVSADPDTEGAYDVSTVIDGRVVDEQSVTAISGLVANDWVTFSGTGSEITETAGTALTNGVDPTVATMDYAAFLTALEPYQFDIVAYDGADASTITAFGMFVERVSQNIGRKCQAVMANAQAENSEWVISVNNGVVLNDGTTLKAQQAVWWLAGAEAGAPYNKSLTYAQYPGAVAANPKLSNIDVDTAILAGEVVFIDDFNLCRVCTDINTLTTFAVDKGKEYSKNRVMRVLNQFCNDTYRNFSLNYIGKIDNNEAGRELLRGWIVGYLNEMQANNGIQNFVPEDVTVAPGEATDAVLITAAIQPVDSVEKIYVSVTVTVNAGTRR